jgi:hypothetical protein
MSLDPGPDGRSASPESSGRDSPLPRQWRNQLGDGSSNNTRIPVIYFLASNFVRARYRPGEEGQVF